MRLVILSFIISSVAGLALGRTDPRPYWTCESVDTARAVNQCRARCRETSDAKNAACNDAYRSCGLACSGSQDEFRACRDRCRATYETCRKDLPAELDRCANGCVTDAGCQL